MNRLRTIRWMPTRSDWRDTGRATVTRVGRDRADWQRVCARILLLAGWLVWMVCVPSALLAQRGLNKGRNNIGQPQYNAQQSRKKQPHLGEWFLNHQNLTQEQQQQALRKEPGFNHLPAQEQQRLQARLRELNAMPPAERERTIAHMEALEKLSPAQRQQMGRIMQKISQLPADRQSLMRAAFHNLRDLPPEQRQAMLSSSQFKSQFSDAERQMLGNLMTLEPYLPPDHPSNPPVNNSK